MRFEADLDLTRPVSRCNCTQCTKRGATASIIKPAAFRLLTGENALADYEWGGRTGRFRFCSRCGIFVFFVGNLLQLGGAYVSVNVQCLDDIEPSTLKVIHWDGRHNNWGAGPRDVPWAVHAPTA
ncbi:MAG TPA: type I-B CRISPR-associated protein Cas8b1/Cst1 [Polyangiaceae bacterium]|nr:type I-B CRISPR-associated protein Cas8b1/Cst1 [Polyangiaceae bacterium]